MPVPMATAAPSKDAVPPQGISLFPDINHDVPDAQDNTTEDEGFLEDEDSFEDMENDSSNSFDKTAEDHRATYYHGADHLPTTRGIISTQPTNYYN